MDGFKKITIPLRSLSEIGDFKAVTARGKPRPNLNKEDHKNLVENKFSDGESISNHITIFRVSDKKKLTQNEIKNHTVQGPEWTPQSSLAFVMGAQSKGLRTWSATKPTQDHNGLLGKNGGPSIFARESISVINSGWMAREPKEDEKYGTRTKKAPVSVFTPPSSPRNISIEELKSLMNVEAGWDKMPISLGDLERLSTPIPSTITDCLKKNKLTREDLSDELLTILVNTEGVLNLLNNNILSFAELNKASFDVVRELLKEEEIIILLSDGTVRFDKLVSIYSEYIDCCDSSLGEFRFHELYDLISGHETEFSKLFHNLELSVNDIIELYNKSDEMFCDFAGDDFISFFQKCNKYNDDIDIVGSMVEIYRNNSKLLWDLIQDEKNMLDDISIEEFIRQYEEAQGKISQIHEDNSYYDLEGIYNYVYSKYLEDCCSDEFLSNDSSSDEESYDNYNDDYEDQENSYTDADSVSDLEDNFDKFDLSSEYSEDDENAGMLGLSEYLKMF